MLPLLVAVLGGCGSQGARGAPPGPGGRPGGSSGGAAGQAMGPGGLDGGLAPGAGGSAGASAIGAGAGGSRGAAAAGGAAGGTIAITGDPNAAGFRPLRLLTDREYLNTVRDLFAVTTYIDDLGETKVILPPLDAETEDPDSGFAFHATGAVVQKDSLSLETAAEQLAKAAVGRIDAWLPCAATAAGDAAEADCLSAFFAPSGFATKIFRRPLSTEDTTGEVARLTAL